MTCLLRGQSSRLNEVLREMLRAFEVCEKVEEKNERWKNVRKRFFLTFEEGQQTLRKILKL